MKKKKNIKVIFLKNYDIIILILFSFTKIKGLKYLVRLNIKIILL